MCSIIYLRIHDILLFSRSLQQPSHANVRTNAGSGTCESDEEVNTRRKMFVKDKCYEIIEMNSKHVKKYGTTEVSVIMFIDKNYLKNISSSDPRPNLQANIIST